MKKEIDLIMAIRNYVMLSIILFMLGACQKGETLNDTVCGVKDPLTNISWLNEEFKKMEGGPQVNGIILYLYNSKEVIEIQSAVFSSTNQHQYHCDGSKLNLDDPNDFNKYRSERVKVRILYGTKIWED